VRFTCRLHCNYGFESRLASIWRENRGTKCSSQACTTLYVYTYTHHTIHNVVRISILSSPSACARVYIRIHIPLRNNARHYIFLCVFYLQEKFDSSRRSFCKQTARKVEKSLCRSPSRSLYYTMDIIYILSLFYFICARDFRRKNGNKNSPGDFFYAGRTYSTLVCNNNGMCNVIKYEF